MLPMRADGQQTEKQINRTTSRTETTCTEVSPGSHIIIITRLLHASTPQISTLSLLSSTTRTIFESFGKLLSRYELPCC